MCRRYKQRPSEVIGLSGWIAFDFDLAMAAVHRMEDQSHAQQSDNPFAMLLAMM